MSVYFNIRLTNYSGYVFILFIFLWLQYNLIVICKCFHKFWCFLFMFLNEVTQLGLFVLLVHFYFSFAWNLIYELTVRRAPIAPCAPCWRLQPSAPLFLREVLSFIYTYFISILTRVTFSVRTFKVWWCNVMRCSYFLTFLPTTHFLTPLPSIRPCEPALPDSTVIIGDSRWIHREFLNRIATLLRTIYSYILYYYCCCFVSARVHLRPFPEKSAHKTIVYNR